MNYCYIEFTTESEVILTRIGSIYNRIRSDLAESKTPRDTEWYGLFEEEELNYFWWPNEEQFEEVKHFWGDTPVRLSKEKENPREGWDLFSMFEAISHGEYDLHEIDSIRSDLHRLNFDPHAFPYGGCDSLKTLVTSLGGTVVAFDDGTGRIEEKKSKKPWWKLW